MKKKQGLNDPIIFKTLIDKEMKIKQEHKEMLGNYLIQQGYKISKGKDDKTFEEVIEVLKNTFTQIKKLKDSYEGKNI